MKNPKIVIALVLTVVLFTLETSCKKETDNNPTTVTDIDGNVYNTISIGTQVWMAENLKVTHYRNGDTIPKVIDSTQWITFTSGAYCNYNKVPAKGVILLVNYTIGIRCQTVVI